MCSLLLKDLSFISISSVEFFISIALIWACRSSLSNENDHRFFLEKVHVSLRKPAHMIYSNFFMSKIDNFQRKIFDIFLIFAQNIDCGYTLEPPR